MIYPINHDVDKMVTTLLQEERDVLKSWLLRHGASSESHKLITYREDFKSTHFLLPLGAETMPVAEMAKRFPTLVFDYGNAKFNITLKGGYIG